MPLQPGQFRIAHENEDGEVETGPTINASSVPHKEHSVEDPDTVVLGLHFESSTGMTIGEACQLLRTALRERCTSLQASIGNVSVAIRELLANTFYNIRNRKTLVRREHDGLSVVGRQHPDGRFRDLRTRTVRHRPVLRAIDATTGESVTHEFNEGGIGKHKLIMYLKDSQDDDITTMKRRLKAACPLHAQSASNVDFMSDGLRMIYNSSTPWTEEMIQAATNKLQENDFEVTWTNNDNQAA